jgi:hypothetical protein
MDNLDRLWVDCREAVDMEADGEGRRLVAIETAVFIFLSINFFIFRSVFK